MMLSLYGDPLLRPYHADPRFAAFCRKVGLPAPADASGRTDAAMSSATNSDAHS